MNDFTDDELQSIVSSIVALHIKYGAEIHSTSALDKIKHEINRRKEIAELDEGCLSCTL